MEKDPLAQREAREPILSLVGRQDQEAMLLTFRPKSASPGERVTRGDRADGMYFISSGAVEVKVANRTIRREPGAYFGEMALLMGERLTPTAATRLLLTVAIMGGVVVLNRRRPSSRHTSSLHDASKQSTRRS